MAVAKSAGRAARGAPKDQGKRSDATKKSTPAEPRFTKDEELHAYREMLLIRRFEEKGCFHEGAP